jgi:hypothetical protein
VKRLAARGGLAEALGFAFAWTAEGGRRHMVSGYGLWSRSGKVLIVDF